MKNKEILKNYNMLMERAVKEKAALAENKDCRRLPIKVIHAIHTNQIALEKAFEPYAKSVVELGNKYDVDMTIYDLNKKRDEVAKERLAEFDEDLAELLDVDADVNIKKVSVDDFGDDYLISQEDYELIAFMIK